jgi:glycosyltransferase involved in cell wall biosynthesis
VIASDLPEIARVVRQHDLGLLVKPGDTDSLVDALNELVQKPDLRVHYAANADRAAKRLNWEEQEQSLVAMYERILSKVAG